jgi:hypothetical protein
MERTTGRQRFRCMVCATEWAANLCGVCGQPKKGHVCQGRGAWAGVNAGEQTGEQEQLGEQLGEEHGEDEEAEGEEA